MTRLEAEDVAVDTAGGRKELEQQVGAQGLFVDAPVHPRVHQQSLELTGKEDGSIGQASVVERFLAHAVAR